MSKRTIPQREEIICDRCQKVLQTKDRKRDYSVFIKASALDNLGDPCANANVSFDFCDECALIMADAIGSALVKK